MDILNLEKSKVKRDLLVLYFSHPEEKHYLRELERILGYQASYIRRELLNLEKIGLFNSKFVGRERFFELNKKFIFYKEVKTILEKTYGVEGFLRKIILKDRGIIEAYIYGSYARGTLMSESDIDLLLISIKDIIETKSLIYDYQDKIKREINITELSRKEFTKKNKEKDEFIDNVFKNKYIKLK